MSKHTPAPWYVDNSRQRTAINSEHKHIAMVNYSYRAMEGDVMGEEHEANARLIASAPDLLEALKVATSLCRLKYGNLDAEVYNEILRFESIIAKAEGKV